MSAPVSATPVTDACERGVHVFEANVLGDGRGCTNCGAQESEESDTSRFCAECDADLDGNDPHAPGCPADPNPATEASADARPPRRRSRMFAMGPQGNRYTLREMLSANADDAEIRAAILALGPRESVTLGGGAFATTTIVRVA
jgi:hypothetical protein